MFEDHHGQTGETVACPDCGADVYVPPWESIAFRNATAAREHLRESGQDIGAALAGGSGAVVPAYQLERDQFDELYPAPRLKDFLVGLSQGRRDPYLLEEAHQHY